MLVTVCDACGKMGYKKYEETEYGAGNGFSIFTRKKDGKIAPVLKLDLCPECMASVYSFIREDLMRPESLRYEEICGDGGVIESDDGEIGVAVASSDEE